VFFQHNAGSEVRHGSPFCFTMGSKSRM